MATAAVSEGHGVELRVFYEKDYFSPVCGRDRGEEFERFSFIECRLSIAPGEKSFGEVHDVLRPLFSDSDIEAIEQFHGTVAGQDVVLVVPRSDKVMNPRDCQWCDVAGTEYPKREVKGLRLQSIDAGSDRRLVIIKGRRTIVKIRDVGRRDVLISYEESSEEVAGRIQGRLVDAGFSCRMKDGARARWVEVERSRVMVVCITERYLQSGVCMQKIRMADMYREDSGFPIILPLLLEDVEWPPRDEDVEWTVREILSGEDVQENVCRLHHDDINDWSGPRVEHFIKTVTRLRGVELLVIYDEGCFSLVRGRAEIQDRGEDRRSSFIKCRLSIAPGRKSFRELCDVLRPLFSRSDIEAIEQRQGTVAGQDVVTVVPCSDEMKDPWNWQWYDVAGTEYSWTEVKDLRRQRIHAGSDRRLVIVSGRRTVVEISDVGISSSSEEDEEGPRQRPGQDAAESEDAVAASSDH